MILSMTLYLFGFFISAYIANKINWEPNNDYRWLKQKIIEIINITIVISIPTIIAILRDGIGIDYDNYSSYFESTRNSSLSEYFYIYGNVEFLNYVIVQIGYYITGSERGIFCLYAILTFFFFAKAIINYRNRIDIGFAFLVFYFVFYSASFNIVRQLLAVSIFFYSIKYIESRSFFRYVVCLIGASLVHNTAIVCFAFYFVCSEYKIIRYILCFFIFGFTFFFSTYFNSVGLILEHFSNYENEGTNITVTYILRSMIYIPAVIIILLSHKWRMNKSIKILLFLIITDYIFVSAGLISKWAFRLGYYAMTSQILIIPLSFKYLKNSFLLRTYYIAFLFVQFIVLYYLWGRDGIFPYKTFL